ncbi:MAG TPA: Clp protease N-terminal domain-containing protein [Leptolyngbyaceae cyanobacterium]
MLDLKNFSSRTRKSINRAIAESQRLGHSFIGSEQLLLGVLGEDRAIAQLLEVSLESVRAEVERVIGRGSGYVAASLPFTPRAKRIVQIATAIALVQEFSCVEPEHLLLGIADRADGIAYNVLKNLGVLIPQRRQAILMRMQDLPRQPISQSDETDDEAITTKSSLLSAVPPVNKTAPTWLSITTLPQENGRWVAQVSAHGNAHGNAPNFRSIAYGNSDFQAIADALLSLARMYRNYQV